jgi:hypothetical protein
MVELTKDNKEHFSELLKGYELEEDINNIQIGDHIRYIDNLKFKYGGYVINKNNHFLNLSNKNSKNPIEFWINTKKDNMRIYRKLRLDEVINLMYKYKEENRLLKSKLKVKE